MAKLLAKSDAIGKCIVLGKRFIHYYDKFYKTRDNELLIKMQNLFMQVKKIKLLETNDFILNSQLWDWFFTAGANPEDFMTEPTNNEIKEYDTFANKLLCDGNIIFNNNSNLKSNTKVES